MSYIFLLYRIIIYERRIEAEEYYQLNIITTATIP